MGPWTILGVLGAEPWLTLHALGRLLAPFWEACSFKHRSKIDVFFDMNFDMMFDQCLIDFWMLFGWLSQDVGLISELLFGENCWNMPKDVKIALMPEFLDSWIPEFLNSWIPEFLDSWIPQFLNSWIPGFLKAASPFFPPTSHTQHPLLRSPAPRSE